jgi:hypothetical protein
MTGEGFPLAGAPKCDICEDRIEETSSLRITDPTTGESREIG